ncbi:MAG: sulfatase-like hydrolase/transferase [Verrucomicrobiota bacterium]
MNSSGFSFLIVLTVATLSGSVAASNPNIVVILVDDMPWWGTSVAQAAGDLRSTSRYRITPNVEKLAAQGMTFSNAYAAAGMCGPSRASIQTGLSPARTLYSGNSNFGEDAPEEVFYALKKRDQGCPLIEPSPIGKLNSDFDTIGELLQEQGYATAHIGKWHLYGGGPEAHGYDVGDGETSNNEGKPTSGIEPDDPKRIFSITRSGIEFIKASHEAGKPFYAQLSHYVEHNAQMSLPKTLTEFEALESVQALETPRDQKTVATHGAAVKDLDTSVGMLWECLEELGLLETTYVLFTSDNGKDLPNGKESILRGDKWWAWEAGVRVPFIMTGPGIEPGSRSSLNVINYDLLPTFYEIAGGDARALEKKIDGKSLLPILTGSDAKGFEDRALYFHYPHNRGSTSHSAIIEGDFKFYTFYEIPDRPQLFNLKQDLGEVNNLAQQMPERAEAMLSRLNGYLDRVGAYFPKENPDADPEWEVYDPDRDTPPILK